MEKDTLELYHAQLLKVCPVLDENHFWFSRTWCDWWLIFNPVTRKNDIYLKKLNRILMDMHFWANITSVKIIFSL